MDALSLGFNGHYNQDDYDNSDLGLTYSDNFTSTLDVNYTINTDLNLYSFYSYEYFKNEQSGYSRYSNVNLLKPRESDNYWDVDITDSVHTVGFGLDWAIIKDKFDLQLDYTYSHALTETDTRQDDIDNNSLADLRTILHGLNLRANYRLLENMRLQLSYRYEFFMTDDFALDNISPDSIDEVLTLGNNSPDYSAHTIGASIFYEF